MSSNKKEKTRIHGYKLKDIKTGLYLKSFQYNQILWTKKGKIWSSRVCISTLIKHAMHVGVKSNGKYWNLKNLITDSIGNWEIVELTESVSYPIAFIINELIE